MITKDISKEKIIGLDRKATITHLTLSDDVIAVNLLVDHYKDGELVDNKLVSSYRISFDTNGIWVDPVTGVTVDKETNPEAIESREYYRQVSAKVSTKKTLEGRIITLLDKIIDQLDLSKRFD